MMNADKIAKNLDDLSQYGALMMGHEYVQSIREAALAFEAIRKMLKIQWEVEHGELRGNRIRKDISDILDEFHLTEDEVKELDEKYPHHLNEKPKCGACRWLSEEKTVIGRKCVCPDKKYNSDTAKWHQKSCPACKSFERREE